MNADRMILTICTVFVLLMLAGAYYLNQRETAQMKKDGCVETFQSREHYIGTKHFHEYKWVCANGKEIWH